LFKYLELLQKAGNQLVAGLYWLQTVAPLSMWCIGMQCSAVRCIAMQMAATPDWRPCVSRPRTSQRPSVPAPSGTALHRTALHLLHCTALTALHCTPHRKPGALHREYLQSGLVRWVHSFPITRHSDPQGSRVEDQHQACSAGQCYAE
jgi:hypothetical protein